MSYIVVRCGETPTHKNYIECMYLLQKKVVRIVCGVGYRKHTNELFSELHILKLIDIVKLRSACIMYKVHRKLLLTNNLQLLRSLDSDRGHITRPNNTLTSICKNHIKITMYICARYTIREFNGKFNQVCK